MTQITQGVLAFFISLAIAFLATPGVIRLAFKLNLVDDAKKRKHPAHTHTGVIPRAGGLGIYLAILLSSLVFLTFNQIVIGVLIGATGIVILGLIDDRIDLPPGMRLMALFAIVFLVIFSGLGVPYITNPLGGVIRLDQVTLTYQIFGQEKHFLLLANIFALLWITAIMNFVNWSKGVDGQLPGFVGISAIILGILAMRFSSHEISNLQVALLGFIVGGAFLGFLPWNFYPQKIIPGFSGGTLGGYFLGILSILSWGKLGTMALVLGMPLVDALYTIARRVIEGKSPLKGDDKHFHHRLLNIGWGRRRIAVFYWTVSLVFGIAALFFEQEQKFLAFLVVCVMLACFIIIINTIKEKVEV
ncbi:hypothetical protein A3B02_01255 [Candidatus Roizmanbacteria bacterium RIFCSPLOWO2_01_FULL_42_14]|uniref:Undecaprenyl-phosphate alpha-N-acetylglucosaminyl 1-phosphate transferase n=4 Tax=Candidatus Roizmaniibacteriota TaxID=1752723 RepID=A0A1F7JUX2_9BACT|nr:MAG: hypothetical protein A3D08_02355 [Candidatus Roizmanbacteria bacterium RIFCSPHIGHO2_02_FULL_43_11]OGK38392.1 MAG: hypothetical protein A3F32_00235 [Candidatus Roizmanbacteria bacterium RIFCSPHIGHO2_12_FULL_42_10]OGK52182.1 MAG: hypothetical protein A3B02_01255 [Candidatus Roizmanbacteria bacterium RIFCSPLOWO2_01_FULL_42_14]OGK59415.1 MAG: hypothetical protein A3I56_01940 [Candidatus Roizmanbacteria bacterium RIFCSPLOWO2_02_FULL_43_10]